MYCGVTGAKAPELYVDLLQFGFGPLMIRIRLCGFVPQRFTLRLDDGCRRLRNLRLNFVEQRMTTLILREQAHPFHLQVK
jgi:hypothetical protein